MVNKTNFVELVKKFFYKITSSATTLYLTTLGIFIISFGFIFISPSIIGSSYSYENTPIDEYQTLSNNVQIALVKKEFNPENGIMRLDYSLKESSTNSSLSNIQYDISNQDIKNRESQKSEVIRVNDNYLVVIVKDLPKDFGVLSSTINPSYIHPEIQSSNDLENRSLKIYINEDEKIVNKNLENKSSSEYQSEYITFQQESLREEIVLKNKEIEAIHIKNKELKELISDLETDINFQTDEEKLETKSAINAQLTSINQHEKEMKEIEDEIENIREKIVLLDEKKKTIK
ncbi:hypothetical protein CKF96_03705 (plasmid) [Priestia filamentosa]|uniref:hypothetical protein n=1 Tax=Virgibacillus halodenitrificans TaxID=1482 RepID=UPI0009F9DB68|nr:hypothetical protein [Virgibacillus halodenitrificans]AVD54440.1 hypothetical protein CKF96_02705 [Priestia filamentosa]AVD54608.1 hypothetical protein CKF96_03705 [Priestia filamentosa]